MSLIHFNNLYDDLFDDGDLFRLMPSFKKLSNRQQTFYLDVKEADDNYIVKADLPGVDKTSIDITLDNNILTISSERKDEKKEVVNEKYHYYERSSGKYSRSISLPSNINAEGLTASYTDGVLNIIVPKNKSTERKKITVS